MEVIDKLHALASLPSRKETQVAIGDSVGLRAGQTQCVK
jgi:hypothetical protein